MNEHFEYERRVVCFIDILAFSDRIKNTTHKTKDAEQLLDTTCVALQQLNSYKSILEAKSNIKGIHITQFSDSIVISFPYDQEGKDLYLVVSSIKFLQVTMLKYYGILMRGGIVIGDLIHTDNILVGPAMIAAYEIESKCAFSPRIVLDPKVAYRFNIVSKLHMSTNTYMLIKKDLDDTSYVDYFDLEGDEFIDKSEHLDYFKQLCELVAANVTSTNMSVRMKYLWMRNKIKSSIFFKNPEYKDAYRTIVTLPNSKKK